MPFKVTARTILQLGAELISSDAIAFYELIKNAFDAKSQKVEVRIVVRIGQKLIVQFLERLKDQNGKFIDSATKLNEIRQEAIENINYDAFAAQELQEDIESTKTASELHKVLLRSNYILIKDWGEGMSLADLEDIYLTIGTRNRVKEREESNTSKRPILGEKGLGRLSVMRLGEGLKVETTKEGERYFNELEIDWSIFSHDSDALLETVTVTPKRGALKKDSSLKGTSIIIFDLKTDWTLEKLFEVAQSQLGRFIDPFSKKNRDFIALSFNRKPIILEEIDRILFHYAHATVKANLHFERGNPVFSGKVDYKTYKRDKTFSVSGTHLASMLKDSRYKELLNDLGPFSVELFWYNRRLLTKNQIGIEAPKIKELVDDWGGGLMVYRDGFRVNPYGGPGDDWLSLDPTALASPGYKLNRKQIVGKVDIASMGNPNLLDQTNREGLRENPEKNALVVLLQYMIWKELKPFLDEIKRIEDENLAALSLSEIEKRIETGQQQVRAAVEHLKEKYPSIRKETDTLEIIENVLQESVELFKTARASSDALEGRLKTTIDLAGLGLMVDVIAHELNRSTDHALKTINSLSKEVPTSIVPTMDTLKTQLKTLQARLKVLDPLGPSGRQVKSTIDLRKLIIDTLDSHRAQFKRHRINLEIIDTAGKEPWMVKVVPGMIVQIIENLISNSVYWIKQEQNLNKLPQAKIEVLLNRKDECIIFSDNGPGISRSKKEDIFRPFFSTKPPGDGKGLGLYISREMASYHNASLALVDDGKTSLKSFILSLNS
jgi:signal transduction histidine kinase